MDFQETEPGIDGSETSLHRAAKEAAPSTGTGLPRGVSQALADPIVKALMVADRVDPQGLEELLRRTAAQLSQRDPQNRSARFTLREKPAASTGLATLAKSFILALAMIAGLSAEPALAAADGAPVAFIRALGDQAAIIGVKHCPATGGEHDVIAGGEFGNEVPLATPKPRLPLALKDQWDIGAGTQLEFLVAVQERVAEQPAHALADGRLARTHRAYQENVAAANHARPNTTYPAS